MKNCFFSFKKLIFTFACVLAIGNAFGANLTLSQDTDGYYKISTCQDLKAFSDWVNEVTVAINSSDTACISSGSVPKVASVTFANPNPSVNVRLTNDINCSGVSNVQPIGAPTYKIHYSEQKKSILGSPKCDAQTHDTTFINKFSGNFDGAGYTIYNLTIKADNYVGLIGYAAGGTISDVYIENSTFEVTGTNAGSKAIDTTLYYYSGAIVGYMESGTIFECATENTTVTGPSKYYQAWASGGIVGRNKSGRIEKCTVRGGSVTGRSEVGGIVGINEAGGTVTDCLASPSVLSCAIQIATGFGGIIGKNEGALSRVVYTGSSVKSNNSGSNAIGGPIVGAGTGCDSKCFYTENVGLAADGNDAFEDDIEKIKKSLGEPWNVYSEDLYIDPPSFYYVVMIEANGHGNPDSVVVRKMGDGLIPQLDSIVSADKFKRIGICKDAACTQVWNWKKDKVTSDLTLYTNWGQAYLVNFVVGTLAVGQTGRFPDGAITTKYCVQGEKITGDGITEPRFTNAAFDGWSLEDDYSADASLGTMGTTATTVYAIGTTNNVVYIYYLPGKNGTGDKDTLRVVKGRTVALAGSMFTRSGYAQDGWATGETGSLKYSFGESYPISKNLTLYPHWKSADYTIGYLYSENTPADLYGNTVDSEKKAAGVDYYLSTKTFTREGYTQEGWSRIEGGDKSYDLGDKYTQDVADTFYPYWVVNTHTLTYRISLDGGQTFDNLEDGVESVDYGTEKTVRAAHQHEGFTMGAWTHTPTNLAITNGKFTMPDADVQFTSIGTRNNYTITYYVNDAQDGDVATVAFDAEVTVRDGSKTGYTFSGWTWYSLAGAEPLQLTVAPSKMPAYNLKVAGTLTPNPYDVTFNANGGAFEEGDETAKSVNYDAAITSADIATPTRVGYDFLGWARAADATAVPENLGTMDNTEGVNVYAVWQAKTYTITFNSNGGSSVDNLSAGYETEISAPEKPTKDGYTFEGWFTDDETFKNQFVFSKMPLDGAALFAKWSPISYTITYNLNNGTNNAANPAGYTIETETITLLPPTKNDYVFAGWYKEESFTNQVTEISQGSTGEKKFFAKWLPEVVVTIESSTSSSYNGQKQTIGVTVTGLPDGYSLACSDSITDVAESPKTITCNKIFDANGSDVTGEFGLVYTNGVTEGVLTITRALENIVTVSLANWSYGAAETPNPVVTGFGAETATFAYANANDTTSENSWKSGKPTDVGNYYVKAVIAESDNYVAGSAAAAFEIVAKSAGDLLVTVSPTSGVYNGAVQELSIVVKDGDTELEKGVDYTVSITKNGVSAEMKNVGDYTIIITGMGIYGGDKQVPYTIAQASETITVALGDWTYGDATVPTAVVTPSYVPASEAKIEYAKAGEEPLVWKDEKPTDAGNYVVKVTVEETDNYRGGSDTKEFTIEPKSATDFTVIVENDIYDGTSKTPTIVVKDGETELKSPENFTIVYPTDMTSVGKHEITIEGTGNYDESITVTYIISPEVKTVLPENVDLVCNDGATGAANCSEDGKSIVYVFGTATNPLPNAVMKDASAGSVDESWTFDGWYDNENLVAGKIDETTTGKKVESIPADQTDALNLYPKFTKTVEVVIGDQTIDVVIDNNDNADSVNAKVTEAAKTHVPAIEPDPKQFVEDPYDNTFDGYVCELKSGAYACEAHFAKTHHEYSITYNLPAGASSSSSYTYSETEDFALATNIEVTGWTFSAWYANAEHSGDAVAKIAKGTFGDQVFYALYTQQVTVKYGDGAEDVLNVTIDSDDDADDIEKKIEDAVKDALDGKLPEKGTTDDDPYRYEFEEFVKNPETGNYEPSFKSIPKEYTITYNMNGGTAPAESFQKYTYSETAAFALPVAADVPYANWTFGGWFTAADYSGSAVTEIAAKTFGNQVFYALYTQKVTVKYGDGVDDVLDVTIDSDDSADDIEKKIEDAVKDALDGKLPEKGTTDDDPYRYEFEEFVKNPETGNYEPSFKSIPKEYTITYNMNGGTAPAESFQKYTYSETAAFALPVAADVPYTNWTFGGWFAAADYSGSAVTEIAAKTFGDQVFYALYTQQVAVKYGDGVDDVLDVTIDSDDDADDIEKKIEDAVKDALDGKLPEKGTTDDDPYRYEFEEFVKNPETGNYEPSFKSIPKEYTITYNMNGGTAPAESFQKYTYSETAAFALPVAADVPYTNWTFGGWFAAADYSGSAVTEIAAKTFGDQVFYALYTQKVTVKYGDAAEDVLDVTIDSDDDADDIEKKIEDAVKDALDGKLPEKGTTDDDPYRYEFEEFVKNPETGNYEPSFKSIPKEYTITYNMNGGTAPAESFQKYTYSETAAFALPVAADVPYANWTFGGWFTAADYSGSAVTEIAAKTFGNQVFYALYTQIISVTIGGTTFLVTIDSDDSADDINAKILAEAHNQGIEDPTKTDSDGKITYEFEKYNCAAGTSGYTCENVFKETYTEYTVAVNLPDNAKLVCTEGADGAVNCSDDGKSIKHTYGTVTKPLPSAVMTDKLGEVDDSWNFVGWFDNKDGIDDGSLPDDKGNKVDSIEAEAFGDNLEIFPYFEKVIHVVLSEDPLQEVDVAIDNNDDADSVSAKVTKAAEDNGFEKPKKDSDGKYDYAFSGYKCTEVDDSFECEAGFDRTPIVFEVAVNLPANAKLICDAGAKGAENCADYGKAIYHTYGIETTPLPDVAIVNNKGVVDDAWTFEGWFDNKDGINDGANGNKVTSIEADATSGESIYPYLTKTVVARIGDETIEVVIDNNDTQDSINAKVTKAAAEHEPPIPTPTKDKDDEYEYTFTGYECDANFVCEAKFDGKPYDVEVVVAYGDGDDDTLNVTISSIDSESDIEKKIEDAMKNHVPEIPFPTKDEDSWYTYEFDKFEKNKQTGRFEPTFKSTPRLFQVSFNLPKSGKLTREFKGYVYGKRTELPGALIENDDEWQFKGWYTKKNGAGNRVKVISETETGVRSFYPLFQKTIKYDARGNKGEIVVIYEDNPAKTIERALNGVIPMDYQEKDITYSFDKWVLKNSVYTATFTEKTSVIEVAKPSFGVNVSGHTLEINGAPMNARVAVFNMSGRMVAQGIVENGTQRVELTTPGSYVVRVNSQVVRVNVK